MEIRTKVEPLKGIMSAIAIDLNANNIAHFADCYKVEHKPCASLFEPINGNPFVNVINIEDKTVTRHTFKPDNAASGTDAMRARILAERFFNEVAAA